MANGVLQGAGTEADPYLIEDAADLAKTDTFPTYQRKYYKQVNDIDLEGVTDFKPIGHGNIDYDGNGFSLKNISMTATTVVFGIFVSGSGSYSNALRNIKIKNAKLTSVLANAVVGGLLGRSPRNNPISNCSFEGTLIISNPSINAVGGLIGEAPSSGTMIMEDCSFKGLLQVVGNVSVGLGGLVGANTQGASLTQLSGCKFEGEINAPESIAIVGGLVGNVSSPASMLLNSCIVMSDINAPKSSCVGGILGGGSSSSGSINIKDSSFEGDLIGVLYVGGIIGAYTGSPNIEISNSYTFGSILGARGLGGLVGHVGLGSVRISNSYSSMNITSQGASSTTTLDCVGGLLGRVGGTAGSASLYNSYSRGSLKGPQYVGGIIGATAQLLVDNCFILNPEISLNGDPMMPHMLADVYAHKLNTWSPTILNNSTRLETMKFEEV